LSRPEDDEQGKKHTMRIAIASGKGGTGKTTVATNLAVTAAKAGSQVAYLDCDVEEPNGALFLRPQFDGSEGVYVSIPELDASRCCGCGRCGSICAYSAIVSLKKQVMIFPELCHGCGGCWLVCPTGAITEGHRRTGQLQQGMAGDVRCFQGLLDVGEAMSPPVITAVKEAVDTNVELTLIDCPPGTSCPVIESVRGADYVLLVTEPTPFGLHDLKLAVEMVRVLRLPFGVVINRADAGDDRTRAYCKEEGIAILAEIPDDREVAQAYSRGEMACEALPAYLVRYRDLLKELEMRVGSKELDPL